MEEKTLMAMAGAAIAAPTALIYIKPLPVSCVFGACSGLPQIMPVLRVSCQIADLRLVHEKWQACYDQ